MIPTGNEINLNNTYFDFRSIKKIENEFDNTWVIKNFRANEIQQVAFLLDKESGRKLEVYSDEPSIQIYTGNHLEGVHKKNSGICLETQHFPDSPNQYKFPSTLLNPGEIFSSTTIFKF